MSDPSPRPTWVVAPAVKCRLLTEIVPPRLATCVAPLLRELKNTSASVRLFG